ncbi:MAG: competence/damage-inducible protein A [Candidatus Hydrothermae bacterium]|nr:competence/damage-inducible protein A [Candidatus Hydrothermae bacterium]
MEVNLIGKTELWITNIKLQGANLSEISRVVAKCLGLNENEVFVVDAGPNHITLDVLRETLNMEQFAGKERLLFEELSKLDGIIITEDATIHSEGILAMISLKEEEVPQVINQTQGMIDDIKSRILKRVKVIPTGNEVVTEIIQDTNSPLIKREFEKLGYEVNVSQPVEDDERAIANAIESAIYEGYGIIITTGGVGAEEKDKTVEATKKIDPGAATPYIVYYNKGSGRHAKDGVKIGVGKVGEFLIINLPGPNEEVKECLDVLIPELEKGNHDKEYLANLLASKLRERLLKRGGGRHD